MILLLFWLSVAAIVYAYFGYHFILKLASFFLPNVTSKETAESQDRPKVSVIVACYNEEKVIANRITNLLSLTYPRDLLEIVIASDGSSDQTASIASQYQEQGVVLLDLKRSGKAFAQNKAVAAATGDIIIFTDADSDFAPDYVEKTVNHFNKNKNIGMVIGNLTWKQDGSANAGLRNLSWKVETDLREIESHIGILARGSGAAMAFKKELYQPMNYSTDDTDSLTPMDVIKQGYKIIFAKDAMVEEIPFSQPKSEYRAKIRGVSKSVTMILRRWQLMDWLKRPVISWTIFSHHFARWLVPYFALTGLISSFFLWQKGPFYQSFIVFELVTLSLIALGLIAEKLHKQIPVASTLFCFAVINTGMAVGFAKAVLGRVKGPWETE